MRSAVIAALVVLATTSVVSAQTDPQAPDTSNTAANHAAKSSEVDGPTASQEDAIPYHPCMVALGWVDGRLQCRNN